MGIDKGRPSIDPVVFFRLRLIMLFEGIRSERKLVEIAALHLAERRAARRGVPRLRRWRREGAGVLDTGPRRGRQLVGIHDPSSVGRRTTSIAADAAGRVRIRIAIDAGGYRRSVNPADQRDRRSSAVAARSRSVGYVAW
jgi:hypothetical protein